MGGQPHPESRTVRLMGGTQAAFLLHFSSENYKIRLIGASIEWGCVH